MGYKFTRNTGQELWNFRVFGTNKEINKNVQSLNSHSKNILLMFRLGK